MPGTKNTQNTKNTEYEERRKKLAAANEMFDQLIGEKVTTLQGGLLDNTNDHPFKRLSDEEIDELVHYERGWKVVEKAKKAEEISQTIQKPAQEIQDELTDMSNETGFTNIIVGTFAQMQESDHEIWIKDFPSLKKKEARESYLNNMLDAIDQLDFSEGFSDNPEVVLDFYLNHYKAIEAGFILENDILPSLPEGSELAKKGERIWNDKGHELYVLTNRVKTMVEQMARDYYLILKGDLKIAAKAQQNLPTVEYSIAEKKKTAPEKEKMKIASKENWLKDFKKHGTALQTFEFFDNNAAKNRNAAKILSQNKFFKNGMQAKNERGTMTLSEVFEEVNNAGPATEITLTKDNKEKKANITFLPEKTRKQIHAWLESSISQLNTLGESKNDSPEYKQFAATLESVKDAFSKKDIKIVDFKEEVQKLELASEKYFMAKIDQPMNRRRWGRVLLADTIHMSARKVYGEDMSGVNSKDVFKDIVAHKVAAMQIKEASKGDSTHFDQTERASFMHSAAKQILDKDVLRNMYEKDDIDSLMKLAKKDASDIFKTYNKTEAKLNKPQTFKQVHKAAEKEEKKVQKAQINHLP